MRQTWIVVADGAKAQLYRYQGPKAPLERIDDGELQHVNELSQDLVSDRPGRVFQSASHRRSAIEPATDPKEHQKHEFARRICAYLEGYISKIDNLILVAAPKVLGDLRRLLPDALKQKVTDELSKDLTNIPAPELPRHLQGVLNIEAHPVYAGQR